MHESLVNRLGGLSLPRKSVARLTDLPDMTLHGRKQHNNNTLLAHHPNSKTEYVCALVKTETAVDSYTN